jgi:hypothetical protein
MNLLSMDNRVTDVNTHCHLGLDLQSNCKWGDYVSNIYKKGIGSCFTSVARRSTVKRQEHHVLWK